jgi:hypothetical protein
MSSTIFVKARSFMKHTREKLVGNAPQYCIQHSFKKRRHCAVSSAVPCERKETPASPGRKEGVLTA